jgi:hypothetical protein
LCDEDFVGHRSVDFLINLAFKVGVFFRKRSQVCVDHIPISFALKCIRMSEWNTFRNACQRGSGEVHIYHNLWWKPLFRPHDLAGMPQAYQNDSQAPPVRLW